MSATVLCVDDNKFDLVLYKAILDEAGYTVLLASCGEEALNILSNINCDLVLLDHTMPNMSGLEVCKAIRSKQDLFTIPVVYATSSSDRNVKADAFEAGVSDFISKPVDPIELAARIRNLLKAKEHQDLISQISRGDTVVTHGGLIGKVFRVVDDKEILVEIGENVKVRVLRQGIADVRAKGEPMKAEPVVSAPVKNKKK